MTLEITVTDSSGNPLANVEVTIVNYATGLVTSRYSDGKGYTNQGVAGAAGELCTLTTNGYSFDTQYYTLTDAPDQKLTVIASPFKQPFRIAPRFWKANMCGIRISGLPAIPGGAPDPSVFLTWMYGRYDATWRKVIRNAMRGAGYTHWLLSWPDERANGCTPDGFKALCQELIRDGFYPCPMWCSKDYDPSDVPALKALIQPALSLVIGLIPLSCVGWELSIWLSPTQVQELIDWMAPQLTPSGCRLYVHFQEGYGSYQQPNKDFADFWIPNVGKLTGVLRQKKLSQNRDQYRYDSGGISDVLTRFAGNFNVPKDSGFDHPFDDVELEITATFQYNGSMTETDGDSWGQWAIDTPAQYGPAGAVTVMGSGNGAQH